MADPVILANVWRIQPEDQAGFVEAAEDALDTLAKGLPGFLGAEVLASLNGTEVIVQVRWESVEHVQHLEGVPEMGRVMRQLRNVAHQDRNTYRVAARIEGGGA